LNNKQRLLQMKRDWQSIATQTDGRQAPMTSRDIRQSANPTQPFLPNSRNAEALLM
jgi:hypothetical protein